ncbi:MAG: hypothetical protein MSG64_03050 [Pyrinomonadaceae bacterium MAG19_C2-C3]|nr:hypothetical protein [Pyrinomonadaceae bacterium MAG19_C2-C3]
MSSLSSRTTFIASIMRADLSYMSLIAPVIVLLCSQADITFARSHPMPVIHIVQQVVEATSAPPPLRRMSAVEQTKLGSADDAKQRARFTLELADRRLSQAEQSTAARDFANASLEIGAYQALIDDALAQVKNDYTFNKARDVYKRFDLNLRSHVVRLETMRRITPSAYAVHITTTVALTRRTRTAMLNMYFGSNVVDDELPVEKNDGEDERAPDKIGNDNARQPPSQL